MWWCIKKNWSVSRVKIANIYFILKSSFRSLTWMLFGLDSSGYFSEVFSFGVMLTPWTLFLLEFISGKIWQLDFHIYLLFLRFSLCIFPMFNTICFSMIFSGLKVRPKLCFWDMKDFLEHWVHLQAMKNMALMTR